MIVPATEPPFPPAAADAGHADLETLVDYLHGGLSAERAERLRDHLTGCRECAELLLDLETFERGDPADAEAETERADSWRRLRADPPWPRRARLLRLFRRHPQPLLAAAAAAALAAAVGLGLWSLHLQQLLEEPRPDHVIVDLYGPAVTRGSGEPESGVRVPGVPPGGSFTVVIWPEVVESFAAYEMEIVDRAGEVVWRGRLTPPDPESPHLTLGLSRRMLDEPVYEVRLWGLDGDRREAAGEYGLEFTR